MSSDPGYQPPDDENIQPTPPSRYDAWDRGDEDRERVEEQRRPPTAAPSDSLFGFLEVTYPWRPRFPASAGWAVLYFGAALCAVVFFWIFAQLIPGLVAVIGVLAWNIARFGLNRALPPGQQQQMEMFTWPTLLAGHIAAISLGLLFLRLILGPQWTRRLALRLPGLWHLLLTVLLVPALVILATGVYGLAKQFLPNLGDLLGLPGGLGMEQIAELFAAWPWWLAVLLVGVGPALGEELWCRGFMGLGLLGRNGVAARLLFTSFFFGVLHGDPQQGTMAAVMGLVLFYVLLTTRCFWMPVLLHFLNNSIDVVAARFEWSSALDQRAEDLSPLLYLGAVVLFAAIAVSLYRTRARLTNADGSSGPLLWEPTYAGVEHPPANSGVVVKRPNPDIIDLCLIFLGVGSFVAVVCTVAFGAKLP